MDYGTIILRNDTVVNNCKNIGGSMAEFKYEIVKKMGVISQGSNGWQKEFNLISWSEREPKYDIRDWSEGHEKMGKGITLSENEMRNLYSMLSEEIKRIDGK